jgi:hypothetical protein
VRPHLPVKLDKTLFPRLGIQGPVVKNLYAEPEREEEGSDGPRRRFTKLVPLNPARGAAAYRL